EAIVSYRQAIELDSTCAMCYWGMAWALGPNINAAMDSAAGVAAYQAVQKALALSERETPKHQAFVRALARRYTADPSAERAALDSQYAVAMDELASRYPDDPEAQVLAAEALMLLSPWDYWTADKQPREGTETLLGRLEAVTERNPNHPGACHFFIHAVEAAYPERAVVCAERLAKLMPGAGHVVHMPGHIYIRVGRYADAIEANEHAVHADETWIQDRRPGVNMYTAGYYPHNYDFMAFAAAMAGRRDRAVEAANKVQELVPVEMAPSLSFLQHWYARPLQLQVRFGLWDEILEEPAPPEGLPHARALWHFARGRAVAARGDVGAARTELAQLKRLAADPALEGVRMEFNLSGDLLAVAEHVLAGRIAAADGDYDKAVALLSEAARLEDELTYGEPPEWTVPVRHELGAVLVAAGRPGEAERVYRQDLERFPENGWSLRGLAQALRAQGKTAEADRVETRFRRAWAESDVELSASSY
ncbi:MAG: hypothetical protein PVI01_02365, partial [Gemmatimonadales bacterium]